MCPDLQTHGHCDESQCYWVLSAAHEYLCSKWPVHAIAPESFIQCRLWPLQHHPQMKESSEPHVWKKMAM